MKIFMFSAFVLFNLIFQATILPEFTFRGVKPDLLLIIVIFAALLKGTVTGVKVGFFIGLAQDLLSGKFIGLFMLSKMFTGLCVGLVESKIFKENYLVPIVVLFFGTILHEFLFTFFGDLICRVAYWGQGWNSVVLPLAVYHACIGPFLYVPAYKIYVKWWHNKS
ncbi:MAG: rod shape-determining protein MreD [Bacillota bacterium]